MKRNTLILPILSQMIFVIFYLAVSCSDNKKQTHATTVQTHPTVPEDTIIDSRYTFEEAVDGSKAPQHILDQLELIEVTYVSTDEKIHKGQLLTNQKIADDLVYLFHFMLNRQFVIEKAIPIVKYDWNDSLSMADNNTYSFCYRNSSYSKHAEGMAVDINPRFNPLRWKDSNLSNKPKNGILDTTANGTFYPGHPVVNEFIARGFRWGHTFSKYYDDHHFEKN